MANIVICLLDSPSFSWWYAFERSSLLKTVELFRSAISLDLVFLEIATTGFTHGVGPVTSSMTSISLGRFNSASTSFFTRKGILRCRCVTGGTKDSMWRLIMTPEIFLILPSNSEGNSSKMGTDTWNVKLNVIMSSASAEWALSKFCSLSMGNFIVNHEYLDSASFSPEFHRGINKSSDRYRLLGSVGK